MTTLLPIGIFAMWLAQGDRGLSSEAIVSTLTGIQINHSTHVDYPRDPADFRRCALLLEAVPLAALILPAMTNVSPVWARFVDAWAELEALALSEVPEWPHPNPYRSAPLLYARMQEVIKGATP